MRPLRDPAGERNCLVSLEKNTPDVADDGQAVASWAGQFQRYAKVIERSSAERRVFEQVRAEVDFIVRMPFDVQTQTIKPADWRVDWSGRKLNIGSAVDVGQRRTTIELHCTEIVV